VAAPTPNADRDIVVHRFTLVDALTGDAVGERWSVWLGRDNEGSFDSERDALAAAQRLAEDTGRDVWLGSSEHGWKRMTAWAP
jgi:hypothetical protein